MRRNRRDRAEIDFAGCAVEGYDVALVEDVLSDVGQAGGDIDDNTFGSCHAGLAHAARHDRGVRRLAAAAGQYALCRKETVDVLGACFLADEDDLLTRVAQFLGDIGIEYALARCRPR